MPMSSYVDSLGRVADGWLKRDDAIRLKAIEALQVSTGYKGKVIAQALDNVFLELTRDKLESYLEEEKLGPSAFSDSVVFHIGAGNVFTSWLPGAVISLLIGYRCAIKPSTREPVFARLWLDSIGRVDVALAARVSIVPWSDEVARRAYAVVAYGTDQTIRSIQSKVGSGPIFVGYGHKMSAAVVLKEAMSQKERPLWRERAIRDCALFDLNGCLSPQVFYIEGQDSREWESISDSKSRGPVFRTFTDFETLLMDLKPFQGQLSCIGVAGPQERLSPVRSRLEALGLTRVCSLGEMQRPPLSWRNGGISLAERLDPFLAKADGKGIQYCNFRAHSSIG